MLQFVHTTATCIHVQCLYMACTFAFDTECVHVHVMDMLVPHMNIVHVHVHSDLACIYMYIHVAVICKTCAISVCCLCMGAS